VSVCGRVGNAYIEVTWIHHLKNDFQLQVAAVDIVFHNWRLLGVKKLDIALPWGLNP